VFNNVFRRRGRFYQHIGQRERERLLKDYIRARDNYWQAVAKARGDCEDLVRLGVSGDGRSEQ